MERGGVKAVWDDFGPTTKKLFGGMWVAGFSLLVICSTADIVHAAWLQNRPFIPNVLAGLVGFLIGVPVALVGLAAITTQREEKAAKDRVQALTRHAWKQFRGAVYEFCNQNEPEKWEPSATKLYHQHDQIRQAFINYAGNCRSEPERAYQALAAYLELAKDNWQRHLMEMSGAIGSSQNLRPAWHAVVRDWNTLDQYVRLQRLERGLPWIDRTFDSLMQERMNADLHPMRKFIEIHEGPTPKSADWKNPSMWAAYNALARLTGITKAELEESFEGQDMYFPNTPVVGYLEAVGESASKVRELLAIVQEIERTNWIDREQPSHQLNR